MITLHQTTPMTAQQVANWECRKLISTSLLLGLGVAVCVLGALLQGAQQECVVACTKNEMLLDVLAHAPTATIITDECGQILVWNAGAEKLFGWTEAEVSGSTTDFLIPCTGARSINRRIWTDPDLKTKVLDGEIIELVANAARKDGQTVPVRGTIIGIRNNYRSFIMHFYPDDKITDQDLRTTTAPNYAPVPPDPKQLPSRVR